MRRLSMSLLAVLGLLAAWAAIAWACTPQSYLRPNSTTGRSGDFVTVVEEGFTANTRVELHWNGTSGPLLATSTTGADGKATVSVKIPDVAPGDYYLQAVARTPDGYTATPDRAFRVQAAPTAAPAPTGSAPAPKNGAAAPTAPSRKPAAKRPSRTRAHGKTSPARQTHPAGSKRTSGTPSGGRGRRKDEATAPGARSRAPVSPSPAVDRRKAGQAVFTDSRPHVSHRGSTPANPADGGNATNPFAWHPLNEWRVPGPAGPAAVDGGPGSAASSFGQRTYPATGRTTAGGSGPQLAIGAGVLGLGLVLLFGGFAVAEVRRRRAPAALRSVTAEDAEADDEPDRSTV